MVGMIGILVASAPSVKVSTIKKEVVPRRVLGLQTSF
jgi:hypothetical protein